MNFLGSILTIIFSAIVLAAPRRMAVIGVMLAVCYITQGQQFTFLAFHFTAVRVALLAGFIRVIMRGELSAVKFNKIDYAFMGYVAASAGFSFLRYRNSESLVAELGYAYNIYLSYLVFRALVTSVEDFEDLMGAMTVLIIPLTLCMIHEAFTGDNFFNSMGGRDSNVDWIREGRYRCVGSFRGPHTMGTFGATLIPPFVALYFLNPRKRFLAIVGIACGTIITYNANASGPLSAFLSGLIGLAFWRMRHNMQLVRRGLVAGLIVLAFTMKAPIWYVFAKISAITGGDGWSRSYLMEQCFNHMSTWWLMGTDDTGSWAATTMAWGGADLCNLYVSAAAQGGLTALVLLILLLVYCFRYLGNALQAARDLESPHEGLIWGMGSSLFAHVVTLFSVTYFDQMHVPFWGFVACISSVTAEMLERAPSRELVLVPPLETPMYEENPVPPMA